MSKLKFLILAVLAMALAVTSCTKDPDPIDEAKVLIEYLESDQSPLGKDYVNTDLPTVMAATELQTLNAAGQVYIMDIRSAADYAAGHIANAVNVQPGSVLEHIKTVNLNNYQKVAVVCYTGQTSGWAVTLLRIMGYSKAWSLKFGMCSWNQVFASRWNNAIASGNSQAANFVNTATPKPAPGNLPVLNTGKKTAQEILEARVNAVLTEGFTPATVTNSAVFANLTGYFIVNYWPLAQYNISHIPGAMQYTPKESMKLSADLKTLPTNKPIAIYCYTGQTSCFLAAYLRVIGYDAKSILYGTNGMIYDIMAANNITPRFSSADIMNYTYVTSTK